MSIEEPLKSELDRYQQRALIAGVAGLVICALGAVLDLEQLYRSYLFGYIVWLGVAIGAWGLYMLHHLVGGAWGFIIRRFLSSAARTMPIMAILGLPILAGLFFGHLFPWAGEHHGGGAHAELLHHKEPYLNKIFFTIRYIAYFAIWIGWSHLVFRMVRKFENTHDYSMIRKMQNVSGAGVLLLVLTVTFASIDWMMSLEPTFFSTIYGVIALVNFVLSAIALATILLVKMSKYPPISLYIRPQIFHDLGNLMFGFTILWAYTSFMQFLIIWSGNLAEEVPWYIHRTSGGWEFVGLFLLLFCFFVPFFLLLARRNKRNTRFLTRMAWWLLLMRAVDIFWNIAPAFHQESFHIHWLDIAAPVGVGGIFIWAFFNQLKKRQLLMVDDPRMKVALARIDYMDPLTHISEPLANPADPLSTK